MNKETQGLSTVEQVTALGDQLTLFADELHERILKEMRSHKGGPTEAQQAALRALFDHELELRQRANSLYADAATLVVASLGQSQRNVMALTAAAAEKIRKIAVIKDMTVLVAGVLALAGAVSSGQPAGILAALGKIKQQLAALDANKAPAKPA
jgi:hypothetical protein